MIVKNNILCLTTILVLLALPGFCQKTAVYFKSNDYTLDKKAKKTIQDFIQNHSIQKILLQGHCDSIGSNDYNDSLSNKRVLEVRNYLILNKTPKEIIEIKALGKRIAVNKNQSEKERALNRRVDIELIKTATPFKTDQARVVISGIILSDKKQPLIAEITLNDKNGKEIQRIFSDKNGKYELTATLKTKEDYHLTYFNDSSFISSKKINLSNPLVPYNNLTTILPSLKGGSKYILGNLNFGPGSRKLVESSLPSLEALYKLLKKNRSLVIRIEGHVNYPSSLPDPSLYYAEKGTDTIYSRTPNENNQWLSDERAKTVYNYLIEKGIKAERISTIGFGATKMLFPHANTESEMAANRRVEIKVVSFKDLK